MKRKNG